jgi:hypothetical protein
VTIVMTGLARLMRLAGEPTVEIESELDLLGAEIGEAPAQIVHDFADTRPPSPRPG